MVESVQALVGSAVMPVIQVKIMQECTPHQFGIRCAEMEAPVEVKLKRVTLAACS